MSALTASLGDREHEAVRRAQRAHEPSMEEILASIRTIIAEEREPTKGPEAKSAPERPAVVYSKAEGATIARRPEPAVETGAPRVVWRQPEPEAERAVEPPAEGGGEDDAPLVSAATDKAVASAFEALSANLAARTTEVAEGVAREMLRPMLKAWLDENLPAIVERLVQAEIERIVRASR
jgi:cell pole-organizing protein PopZ